MFASSVVSITFLVIIVNNNFTDGSGDGRRKRRNSGRGSDSPQDKSAVSVLLQIRSFNSFWISIFVDNKFSKVNNLQRLRQCNKCQLFRIIEL